MNPCWSVSDDNLLINCDLTTSHFVKIEFVFNVRQMVKAFQFKDASTVQLSHSQVAGKGTIINALINIYHVSSMS